MNLDQAIHELKMGRSVAYGKYTFCHPEYVDEKYYKTLKNPQLLISAKRAKTREAQIIDLKKIKLPDVVLLAAGRTKTAPKGKSFKGKLLDIPAKGQLLPTVILHRPQSKLPQLKITNKKPKLYLAAESPLTLRGIKKAYIKAYRTDGEMSEHLAIIIGDINTCTPIVRVHSCCYTGDLLGSLSCDCRDQLRGALTMMEKNGGGVLVYLMQEGRGIGLINKLKAYKLQYEGLDTVEANEFLGFDDEERGFGAAAEILKDQGITKLQLISNNPKKAKDLEKSGIKVTKMLPMIIKHDHNQFYLATKAKKSGHIIT